VLEGRLAQVKVEVADRSPEELEPKLRGVVSPNSHDALRKLVKTAEEIERLFAEADVALLEGRTFFTQENLELLAKFQVPADMRIKVGRAVRSFCARHNL
jgi:hypothetical protein